jgi:hypothetical protein
LRNASDTAECNLFIYVRGARARRGSDIRKKLFCYRAGDELRRATERLLLLSGVCGAHKTHFAPSSLTMREQFILIFRPH